MTVIVICASLASLLAPPVSAAPRPTLTGKWVLNSAQSDNPRAILEARRRAAAPRRPGMDGPEMGGGMGGGMGGMGGMGGRPGGGGSSIDRDRARNLEKSVLDGRAAFTVAQDDTSVTFTYSDKQKTVLITDGETLTDNLSGIGYVDIRARWERQRLVVDWRFEVGGRVVEAYSLTPDTGQIVVAVEFDFPRTGKLKFRRVYDPAPVSPGD